MSARRLEITWMLITKNDLCSFIISFLTTIKLLLHFELLHEANQIFYSKKRDNIL